MIRKLLLTITLLCALSAFVYSKNCPDTTESCDDDQTCCKLAQGDYGCCPYPNAVCCSDKEHCCPQSTKCNVAAGTCDKSGSTFLALSDLSMKKVATKKTSKVALSITPEQQMDLINGFLEGSELKKFVPDMSDCAANTTSVVNSLRQAVADFSKENVTFVDIADGIQMIGVAIQGLSNATRSCKNLPQTFSNIIGYFGKIVNNSSDWFSKVSANVVKNSAWIMWDFYSLESLVSGGKWKDVGFKLGEIAKYVFKVEMGQYMMMLMKGDESMKLKSGIDFSKLVQCGYKVYNVAVKAEPIVQDLIKNPDHMIAALSTLYGFFKEVQESCSGAFDLTKLKKQAFVSFITLNKPSLSKMPSINDLIGCVKSVKPVAVDIYDAITNFSAGKTDAAINNLEQLSLDAIQLGYSCYNVIKDILADA